jgi:hypothetical protein
MNEEFLNSMQKSGNSMKKSNKLILGKKMKVVAFIG